MTRDRYREVYEAFRWRVPDDFNLATWTCRRWAADRHRLAIYWEDESGETRMASYWDLMQSANRLSNALAHLGVKRGDRVAIILPQRPETVVAYLAIYQMGAIAVPMSFLFGPDALEYRLADSESRVAIVDPVTLEKLWSVREKLTGLAHVIGVAGAREAGVLDWETLLGKAASSFEPEATAPLDPSTIIYTSGTTGPPKGALIPHCALIGNLSGFECSHDGFPQPGDIFWSPADWAWTGGLWDALMPTLYHGHAILGFRGRFDAERAFHLLEKYAIRNAFLVPTALKMMMKTVPEPRKRHDLRLRSLMSAGEAVGPALFHWAREQLGVTVNEMFGQTEINYIVGNSNALWPARAGSMGRPYPGHRISVIDEEGREVPRGQPGDIAVHRQWIDGTPDPVFFLGYWRNERATAGKYTGDWCRTGDEATMDEEGYLWYRGRSDDVFKVSGYRVGPSEIENCLVRHEAVANAAVVPAPDETRGAVVKAFIVLAPGVHPDETLKEAIRAHVKKHLAPYQQPRDIEFIAELPMTTTGKVQRKVLRERDAAARSAATSSDPPKA